MSLFEPEEFIGQHWHLLVGGTRSWRTYPDASVSLDEMRGRLGLLFRALGGPGAIRIAQAAASAPGHRLRLRQAIGLGAEAIELPALDSTTLQLPGTIALFPEREENALLYEWLAAWFVHARPVPAEPDPLRRDILVLREAVRATRDALQEWPGLRAIEARLRAATLLARPRRPLRGREREVEAAILALLGGAATPSAVLASIAGGQVSLVAPVGYRTFLPVPLWGEVRADAGGGQPARDEEPGGESSAAEDPRRFHAVRRPTDQSERGDPLLLTRFETILSLAEMVNVNRAVEDDDEEGARQALRDLPELTIGTSRKRPATRLKLDLDLAPAEAETTPLQSEHVYPEWDWKRRAYHKAHCSVSAGPSPEAGEDWAPDEKMRRAIRQAQRQFEALRPRRIALGRQADGEELDLAALVRGVAERRAGRSGPERFFINYRAHLRDFSVAVLMDASLSTDAWVGGQRVLDTEKAALLALSHGLTACGDEHAIYAFTSRRRRSVTVSTLKAFDERLGRTVVRRISALRPGQYTRMGAAIRHVAAALGGRPYQHRLLLLLSDGKPNDIDHYEGRYGLEDTRMAIREARQAGLKVFGVTVDEHARDYVPYIFGRGGYAIVPDLSRLPRALPAIYRQVTA